MLSNFEISVMFFGIWDQFRINFKLKAWFHCCAYFFVLNQTQDQRKDLFGMTDFKCLRVPGLKGFLCNRGLKVSGTKEELNTLAYGGNPRNIPVKFTADEDRGRKREAYEALFAVNACQLPYHLPSKSANGLHSSRFR